MKRMMFLLPFITLLAGCGDSATDAEKSAKPGLQPGEVYDSGGNSLTNPMTTNAMRHTEGTNSGVPGGPIRAP